MSLGDYSPKHAPRPSANIAQQRIIAIYLVLGGLSFFALSLAAAFVIVGRSGAFAQRSALLEVHRYIEHGREFRVLDAHRMYSFDALRTTTEQDVAALFDNRRFFEGFTGATIITSEPISGSGLALEAMRIETVTSYSGSLPASVIASLEKEDGTWRIIDISFSETGGTP